MTQAPISINYHLWKPCNLDCRFCFATFRDVEGHLSLDDALRLIRVLRGAGCEKLNFAGGEPTLCPHLAPLLVEAKRAGMVTSIVTNGARLAPLIERHAPAIDWIGFSVDSAVETVQSLLGRGRGDHVGKTVALVDLARSRSIHIKLNTVVTRLNQAEDISAFVRRVRPERWKVFQVLPIAGQNDGTVEPLLISEEEFRAFVDRHAPLAAEGFPPVVEDNDAMRGSYVMIDPLGRFYGNATGRHVYSDPILVVGVERALAQVGWEPEKFVARGGRYTW